MGSIFIVGDIHGQYAKLVRLLHGAGLVDKQLAWTGGTAQLWCTGDFFDRGPDGVRSVELIMRLQDEAEAVGGKVESLLGNHEPLLLGALRFADRSSSGPGGCFLADWEINGGLREELEQIAPRHVDWLRSRPAMARVGNDLLVHADATFYLRYGRSVDEVNRGVAALLQSDDHAAWDQLLGEFAGRNGFLEEPEARAFLDVYGGSRIIHGHTPISYMTHKTPRTVTGPYVYANGLCVNVDGGMYRGGPGFLYHLQESH